MPYFIIIRGPLGCGKSTISEKLAHILDAQYIGMDEVLEKHHLDKVPPGAPCIPAENFIKASEIVLPQVKKTLASGKIVIFDACFYHKKVINHLVQNLPFDHYIFTLKASPELCIKRDSERHKTHGKDAALAVHSLVSRFDHGENIDVSGSLEDAVKKILSFLPKAKKTQL
jgi:shikimate kinase